MPGNKISAMVLELSELKVFNLTSEVKFDLGGQRSAYVNVENFCEDLIILVLLQRSSAPNKRITLLSLE